MGQFSNKPSGRPSKRQTLRRGYRIQKRVRDHNKKLRKEARKMKSLGTFKKKITEELEIPNSYPFKEELIDAFEIKKQIAEQQKRQKNLQKKIEKKQKQQGLSMIEGQEPKNELIKQETKSNTQNKEIEQIATEQSYQRAQSHYESELKRAVEASDFVIQVLDARDPLSTRSKTLESVIKLMKPQKQIIIVLNKIDLIPPGNAEAWLKYFRKEYPTILYKAASNNPDRLYSEEIDEEQGEENQKDAETVAKELLSSSQAIGSESLIQLIKSLSKINGQVTAVNVAVIGYPNVGQSSIINTLQRIKVCGTSHNPGFTKSNQEIQIDKNFRIFDTPGVIFNRDVEKTPTFLRQITRPEEIEKPDSAINIIMKKVPHKDILLFYKIPDFSNATQLLQNIALSQSKLLKGGQPDLIQASRIVLLDWNSGQIKYFTNPPSKE